MQDSEEELKKEQKEAFDNEIPVGDEGKAAREDSDSRDYQSVKLSQVSSPVRVQLQGVENAVLFLFSPLPTYLTCSRF